MTRQQREDRAVVRHLQAQEAWLAKPPELMAYQLTVVRAAIARTSGAEPWPAINEIFGFDADVMLWEAKIRNRIKRQLAKRVTP